MARKGGFPRTLRPLTDTGPCLELRQRVPDWGRDRQREDETQRARGWMRVGRGRLPWIIMYITGVNVCVRAREEKEKRTPALACLAAFGALQGGRSSPRFHWRDGGAG